jgi:hypothetical protein
VLKLGSFRERFGRAKVILPVIHLNHTEPAESALRNTKIARDSGADGVFLIVHSGNVLSIQLHEIRNLVAEEYPGFFVGVNCLDLADLPELVFGDSKKYGNSDGIWSDYGGISPLGFCDKAIKCDNVREESGYDGLYFGSVAFKGQDWVSDEDLYLVAQTAKMFMDVIVTSGTATGVEANPKRVRLIRDGAGDHPLALASGISARNIDRYLELVDCFMVSSSILIDGSFYEIDPRKLEKLCNLIKR